MKSLNLKLLILLFLLSPLSKAEDPYLLIASTASSVLGALAGFGPAVVAGPGAGLAVSGVVSVASFIYDTTDSYHRSSYEFDEKEELALIHLNDFKNMASDFLEGRKVSEELFELFDYMADFSHDLELLSYESKATLILSMPVELFKSHLVN